MCRLRTFSLCCVLLTAGLSHAADPVWRALPGAPTSIRIDDVWFLDESMGWTLAENVAYRTLDGGEHWKAYPAPGVTMRSITFSTPSHGWIGSLNRATPFWATVDSGKTWSTVPLPDPQPAGVCGLWCVNENVVYGCGRYDGPPVVLKTTDRGAHWTTQNLSPLVETLVDCRFFTPDSGIVVGGVAGPGGLYPRILSSEDGGATWTVRYSGTLFDAWCWKISFVSPTTGFVSVETIYTAGICLKTTDRGRTWTEIPVPQVYGIQGIGFANESIGWVGSHGRTYRTVDGGLAWERDDSTVRLNRVRFLSRRLGYASGQTIYKYAIPTANAHTSWTAMKTRFRP